MEGDDERARTLMLEHIENSLHRFAPTMSVIEMNQ
jgi:DNA-binding GntR family transcriptional regulator